jgi:phenylalanyl-tRNA synthetase beta chain
MRISLEWLRECVEVNVPIEALVERLHGLGLPVEAIESHGDDTVLDIELTANRPDCMSVLGVAREVALALGRPLRMRRPKPVEHPPAAADRVAVEIADPEGCPRFTARVIEGVRVGPSPAWVQRRLEASGVRAIANVVDITNYVMLELGQPMHAFDYDRVAGHRLIVRRAMPGERLVTLDGVDRALDPEMLVVADAQRAVALAGIIGGGDTEIGPGTTRVLLEAAYWNPITIGRTARRLGLRTEASARFERGMDPAGPELAQHRAAELLTEWCGGRVLRGVVDVFGHRPRRRSIRFRAQRAAAVLGVPVPSARIVRILRGLGCTVAAPRPARPAARAVGGRGSVLVVRPPSFRPDLGREEDLIEEVARIHGYDRIPPTMPRGTTLPATIVPALRIDARAREILARSGLSEVMTLTLVSAAAAGEGGGPAAVLQNPLVSDQSALRTSLMPGLVSILATHAARRVEDVHVFELGRVFRPHGDANGLGARPEERRSIGIGAMGRWRTGWNVAVDDAAADFYHLKGIVEMLLRELGVGGWTVEPLAEPAPWWHPGRAAIVRRGGDVTGRFGELHPDLHAAHRLPHRAYLAEVDLESLLSAAVLVRPAPELPRYPSIERDVAAVVPDQLPVARVEATIRAAAGPLLEALELFDVYSGPPVPPHHRNVAYRLRLRASDRTLAADEAEEIMRQVRITLQEQAGVRLRE